MKDLVDSNFLETAQTPFADTADAHFLFPCQVAAVNSIGKGPFSSVISEQVSSHRPVPSLLVVQETAPIVRLLDADLNLAHPLVVDAPKIVWAAPLLNKILYNDKSEHNITGYEENSSPFSTLIWMDDNSDIYLLNAGSNGSERVWFLYTKVVFVFFFAYVHWLIKV